MLSKLRRHHCWMTVSLVIAMTLLGSSSAYSATPGLIVEEVVADSAAAKAGLRVGDKLLTYDAKPLPSYAALLAAQQNTVGKKQVELRIMRGTETLTRTVPVGKLGVLVHPELTRSVETLYQEGNAALEAKTVDKAISSWMAAAKAAQDGGDKSTAAWLYELVGAIYRQQRRWDDAQKIFETAVKLAGEVRDPAAQSRLLSELALSSQNLDDYTAAIHWYQRAVQVDTAAGHLMWAAANNTHLGNVIYSTGEIEA